MEHNKSLRAHHTFGVEASTAYWAEFFSEEELTRLVKEAPRPLMVLGGGSNVVFVRNWPGTVLHNRISGLMETARSESHVLIRAGGGEKWHELVMWAVKHGYGGLENLSLIPGTVGAAPIQNIGAYGAELKDVFIELEAIHLQTGEKRVFDKNACRFGYRNSVFKQELKGRYAITQVTLQLTLPPHTVHTAYGDIQRRLAEMGIDRPSIADVSRAVVDIRSSKLPDPEVLGNCGSFFKNPEITDREWNAIEQKFPDAPHYPLPDGRVKVPAGWLIEQCGWKGKRVGHVGAYEKQALVLVNYGGSTGDEVSALAEKIVESVNEKFGVRLELEVNLV